MATDERRRKVAAELRELAANRHYVDEFIAADTVGFYRGEATEGFDSDSLLEVADLIDRPTCAIVESYMGDNLESVEETPHHVLSCGHIAYGEDDPMFSPVCGAAVTDDYR